MYRNQYSPYTHGGMRRGNWGRGYGSNCVASQYAETPATSAYPSHFDGSYRDTYGAGSYYDPWASPQPSFEDSYDTGYQYKQPDVYTGTMRSQGLPMFSHPLLHYVDDSPATDFAPGPSHPSTPMQKADSNASDPTHSSSDSHSNPDIPPADDLPALPSYFACVVPGCSTMTSKQADLNWHYTRHHPNETQESLAAHTAAVLPPPASNDPAMPVPTVTEHEGYTCQAPDCSPRRTFKRCADLDRHYQIIHTPGTKGKWSCDYKKCPRHKSPFYRLDHFRDHLREYHKEDLPRRGALGARDEAWWSSRSQKAMFRGWWRCNRCLKRVHIDLDGAMCACGNECEPERWMRRGLGDL
ncbi:hypothetical protein B0T19DRAFT_463666 [Cercophora scortea]|uniref:C2H2-type domain-containing protein n=1 Tax=Cercophora scortea TaxID=314031 RepID=A0AAE0IEW6_9PEZI|nr:hypothetical protein B0T19DRAFT_463666 [Cercophora scortea]